MSASVSVLQQAGRIKQLKKEIAQMKQSIEPEEGGKKRGEQRDFAASQLAASSGQLSSPLIPQYQAQSKPSPKGRTEEVQKFLNYVAAGAQPDAEAMLKANRDLALTSGTVTDHAKRTFKNITGFQYAVWALDWQMWRMIKNYLSKEAAIEQSRGFSEGSWIAEYGEHVDWKKLMEAQQTLLDNWQLWGYDKINEYWIKQIGGTQLLLPIHILQEYSQPNRPFSPCPNFNGDYVLTRKLQWDITKLGDRVAVSRGLGRIVEGIAPSDLWTACRETNTYQLCLLSGVNIANYRKKRLSEDVRALRLLYVTRTQQRAELLAGELVKDRGLSPSK